MTSKLALSNFEWRDYVLPFFIPDQEHVRRLYGQGPSAPFPYWSRLWPSAIAMSRFLVDHPVYVEGKNVLELAAGLGLPSLVAAGKAREVCCSDYLPEPLAVAAQSIRHNQIHNIHCRMLNWHMLPAALNPDLLLLSDINYNPSEFAILLTVINRFLSKGSSVLLSTPQRLMARPFIEQLLHYCTEKTEMLIDFAGEKTMISLFLLKRAG